MKLAFLTPLAAVICAGTAAALDLTPHYVTTQVEGPPVRRPCFVDGDKKFAVTVDSETELTGYDGSAIFNFTKFPRAVMRLGQSPLKPSAVFEGQTLDRYRAAAAQLLLQGAEQPVLESEVTNVLPINHWTSHRFVFVYKFTGAPMRESVTFLNFDEKQQIVMQIRSRDADFAKITARAEDIIRRWHEVDPAAEVAGN